jgi:hypothetical protein
MLVYTRYPEAKLIAHALQDLKVDIKRLKLLDFGCGVSDYGIFFARLGAEVIVYDNKVMTDFVAFRFAKERLSVEIINKPADHASLTYNKDLVIFGEILEHLLNPLLPLEACVQNSAKFIFTSRYPFGDTVYFSLSAHKESAYLLQPACLKLLRGKYTEKVLAEKRLFGKKCLWIRKA